MKHLLVTSFMVISGLAAAEDLAGSAFPVTKVTRHAQPVHVNSVSTKAVGEHGFPSTQVLANATFSNSCYAPKASELVSITQHADGYNTLIISLGSESRRACPAVYRPVTVTFDLGTYTKPNDGLFSKIVVNGKEAR